MPVWNWMREFLECVFLTAMYDDFKARANREGLAFGISRGKFVRDLGTMLDFQLAHQNNGVAVRKAPPAPKIVVVKD